MVPKYLTSGGGVEKGCPGVHGAIVPLMTNEHNCKDSNHFERVSADVIITRYLHRIAGLFPAPGKMAALE
jgi:hypothetical protein